MVKTQHLNVSAPSQQETKHHTCIVNIFYKTKSISWIILFLQKKPDWSKKGDEKKVKEELEYEA